jgi:O-phosphoseryl-tRNA(Cys) synthetase
MNGSEKMTTKGNLSTKDHQSMDSFLEKVLDWYKTGEITRDDAVGGLAHVMAALDIGNTGEAVAWFERADPSDFRD